MLTRSNFYVYNIYFIALWTLDSGGHLHPPPSPKLCPCLYVCNILGVHPIVVAVISVEVLSK